jgi:hypothetical protein
MDDKDLAFDMIVFLRDWVRYHTLTIDMCSTGNTCSRQARRLRNPLHDI